MVKVVMLDIDGTLMDTNYQHVEAFVRGFEQAGQEPPPYSAIHRQIGKGSDKFLPDFTGGDEALASRVDDLHGEVYAKIQSRGRPLPGAKALLATLKERGFAVWLATSAKPEELEYHLQELGAEDKLAGVVASSDVEEAKPDPDIFAEVLKRTGARPDDAIVVGDTIWDVEAATKVGLRTVAVLTGGAFSRDELERAGAVAVYRDCVELLEAGFPDGL